MIDRKALLDELKPLVTRLVDDLRTEADAEPAVAERLGAEHREAIDAGRTAMALDDWREDELTQGAVAWVLACVFVRFIEDNGLIADPLLSGPDARRDAALGRRAVFFELHPTLSDHEYLLWCFEQVARYPAVAPLFESRYTRFDWLRLSVDGAAALRDFWVRLDPASGEVAHDFSDPDLGTRFLGDLYQELSDAAKKRYALLQTPNFVEKFILDHTLEPALDEFGLAGLRLIDPTCGSGHFLISTFERLFARWVTEEPGTPTSVLAQRALDAVHGVDLNPFATEIARFRLIVAALRACAIRRLAEAPAFRLNLATGDSLLHGPERGEFAGMERLREGIAHVYETEDAPELARILGQGYHVVVGNPPYITPKDPALNDAYRGRYEHCYREYALTVPFMERFFQLAQVEADELLAGYVGKITGNSFMRRDFGVPLVDRFLPSQDVTALVDTSGAYIPGHGTPTVILLGRAQAPFTSQVRVVDGLRGEPSQPENPARGLVWTSLVEHFDRPGTEDRFARSSEVDRAELLSHPLSIGAGRLLRRRIESDARRVSDLRADLGYTGQTNLDEAMLRTAGAWRRNGVPEAHVAELVVGDIVRDWRFGAGPVVWFPYELQEGLLDPAELGDSLRALWPWRTNGYARRTFNKVTYREDGRTHYEWHQMALRRLETPLTIGCAFVATHNHFVLDSRRKVFKQSAHMIKLPAGATEDDYLWLLGALNSSTAGFWLKQVCQNRGSTVDKAGARQRTAPFEDFFEFSSGKIKGLPLPPDRPLEYARRLDGLARRRSAILDELPAVDLPAHVRMAAQRDAELSAEMITVQEELDWHVLCSFGLAGEELRPVDDPPPLKLGERAFEIALARKVERSETESTTWFLRHESRATTELPDHWPADYAERVLRRIALIEEDPDVGLIEQPEHKRRWTGQPSFENRLDERLRSLVLDRLEAEHLWREPQLRTVSELADITRRDHQLTDACALIAGDQDADVGAVVEQLVLSSAVPFLAALRHTEAGLRKRKTWEKVWELQRDEDQGAIVGSIPVPPRYAKTDFRPGPTWGLRGKLDVPKEWFVLVPGAERAGTTSPVVGWAGWDEGTRARALAAKVLELQIQDAADAERLTPLLAGVLELLPWIHQWQPEPDPATGQPLGAFLEDWLSGSLSGLGLTRDDLTAWRPPAPTRGRRRRTATPV
jgi:hypothetical protein